MIKTLSGLAVAFGTAFLPQLASAQSSSPLQASFGNGLSLTFYGYVKPLFIQDYDYDLGNTVFGLRDIGLPTGPAAGKFDQVHFQETRIGFDLENSDFLFKLEGDFFGDDSSLRLRHGYFSWNGFLIGQTWTNFMSVETLPSTVDFQGPAAVPFARLPQVRYTHSFAQDWSVTGSIEEDKSNSDDVHFTLSARKGFENGMVRVAGIYRDTTIEGEDLEGWGLSLSGHYTPWDGGILKGVFTFGEGISDILAFALSGNALQIGGKAVGVHGGAIEVGHMVTPKLKLAASVGVTTIETASGTDTKSLQTLHLSAFYDVTEQMQLGLEYFTGRREQADGDKFTADRAMLTAKFTF